MNLQKDSDTLYSILVLNCDVRSNNLFNLPVHVVHRLAIYGMSVFFFSAFMGK